MSTPAYALRAGNPMKNALLAMLIFEVIVFGLSVPVIIMVSHRPAWVAAVAAGTAALLALATAALLRKPIGYLLGWVTQGVGIALGFLTPSMFVVGGMFAGIWVLSFVLGRRLEAQAAARPPR